MKVYVVGGNKTYANWLSCEIVETIEECDMLLFTGGEDVSPEMYNEPMSSFTHSNPFRDKTEKELFLIGQKLDKYMLGICRGAQLLCVLSGGKLIQHQENRHTYHYINNLPLHRDEKYLFPKAMTMSSDHHQAMYPFNLHESQYRIISTSDESRFHLDGNNKEMLLPNEPEVEIAYFRYTKCLGIQGHPEWMYNKRDMYTGEFNFLKNLIDLFLKNKL